MPKYTPNTTAASATQSLSGGPTRTLTNEDIPASGWSTGIQVKDPVFTATGECDTDATSSASGDRFIGRAFIQYSTDGGSSWNDFGSSSIVDDLFSVSNAQNGGSASENEASNTQTSGVITGRFPLGDLKVRAYVEAQCFSINTGGTAEGTAVLTDWYVTAGIANASIIEA